MYIKEKGKLSYAYIRSRAGELCTHRVLLTFPLPAGPITICPYLILCELTDYSSSRDWPVVDMACTHACALKHRMLIIPKRGRASDSCFVASLHESYKERRNTSIAHF